MLPVAYGEATLDRSNVYRWYKMFSEGREDVNDEERAGRPSTSTTDEIINEVEKMILANRRITVREVAEDPKNISIGSCHSIFINDLGMRRVAAKFVPNLLNCDQKQHRMNIANEMLDSVRDDPNLLQRVITGDEAWVYGYDVETKAQSSQWKLPARTKTEKSAPRAWCIMSFCHRVERSIRNITCKLCAICAKQSARNARICGRNKNWLLHHDNAPAHTSLLVRDFLAKNNTLMMPQPPVWLQIRGIQREKLLKLQNISSLLLPKLDCKIRVFGELNAQLEECYKCHGALPAGEVGVVAPRLGEADAAWHPACFTCTTCEELLVDLTYCAKDGALYCERHYAEQLKPRCAACDEVRGIQATSLVRLVLAEQPLVMELPLVAPASCELRRPREPRAGRPSVSDETIAKVEAAMLEDRRVTVRKLCDLVPDVSKTTIDKILREHLGYSKVCARWVPKMLTEDHKRHRVEAAQKFLDCHETNGEEFLDSIVTGDETWVHYTTPETKEQSKQWKHTSSPKPLSLNKRFLPGNL
ncbi:hypothetical protein LAZ67_5002075 [Cordylochernes scorpioides]|uniref:LIM zinc-binding domain-containing protein n=1 Tax=Cordylochernes scorpioides TaxID=51811 RepID=A0ABY6KG17_9ARAC|nr:hypothetical protein LAZ67_5002075 [Cordylochernes scorpioides]